MRMEMELFSKMFTSMTGSCFKKCVPKYTDERLSLGENACVDRCVTKYMATHALVNQVTMEVNEAQMKEMMAMQQQIKAQEAVAAGALKPAR